MDTITGFDGAQWLTGRRPLSVATFSDETVEKFLALKRSPEKLGTRTLNLFDPLMFDYPARARWSFTLPASQAAAEPTEPWQATLARAGYFADRTKPQLVVVDETWQGDSSPSSDWMNIARQSRGSDLCSPIRRTPMWQTMDDFL